MKKIILGLLVVSAISFAGDNTGAKALDSNSVGVPLEVRANVIPEGARLVLTDGNGKVLDKVMFDHGNLLPNASSTLEQIIYLRRTDNQAFLAGANGKNSATVKFDITSEGQELTNGNLPLHKTSGTGPDLATTLTITHNNVQLKADDTRAFTNVVSIVKVPAKQAEGLYVGTGTFTATVNMQ